MQGKSRMAVISWDSDVLGCGSRETVVLNVNHDVDLSVYRPSERRAILDHKYYLGIELGYDPSLCEVIRSWEENYACEWRRKKMRRDAEVQVKEIQRCKDELSRQWGRSVEFTEAIRVWLDEHEAEWRRRWESSPCSGV